MQSSELQQKVKWPKPGIYVLAVSGGVDSVVLLDMLAAVVDQKDYRLIVAHFDHGMRPDSGADAKFVADLAGGYQLPIELGRGELAGKSENTARIARYDFLEEVRFKYNATAILTAHHSDDEMETIIFNTLRGSNIFGQTGFSEQGKVIRPLKNISKEEIKAYAKLKDLKWREDSSNTDNKYTRNFVRNQFLPAVRQHDPNFDAEFNNLQKEAMQSALKLQSQIDTVIEREVTAEPDKLTIDRDDLNAFSEAARCYVLQAMAKKLDPSVEIKSKTIHESARFVIASRNGQKIDIASGLRLHVSRDKVCLTRAASPEKVNHEVKQRSA